MKVVLINPGTKASKRQIFRKIIGCPPPIGLAYIAAYLENEGHEVFVIDQFAEDISTKEVCKRLLNIRPQAVGFSCLTPQIQFVKEIALFVRQNIPTAFTFAGNAHATEYPEDILPYVDVVIRGEGEKASAEVLSEYQKNGMEGVKKVKGVAYKENGEIILVDKKRQVDNLDSLPFCAWHLFPIEKYIATQQLSGITLGLFHSRGCLFSCTFCAQNYSSPSLRTRKLERTVDEIEYILNFCQNYGFIDSCFPSSKREALEFAKEITKRKIKKANFFCETRPEIVDYETLEALKEAGLKLILFGFETFNQDILNAVEKKAKIESYKNAVQAARRAGVKVYGLFMIGLPNETYMDMKETLKKAMELNPDVASFSRFSAYPGSKFDRMYKIVKRFPKFVDNWTIPSPFDNVQIPGVKIPIQDIVFFQHYAMVRYYSRPKVFFRYIFERLLPLRVIFLASVFSIISLPLLFVNAKIAWFIRILRRFMKPSKTSSAKFLKISKTENQKGDQR